MSRIRTISLFLILSMLMVVSCVDGNNISEVSRAVSMEIDIDGVSSHATRTVMPGTLTAPEHFKAVISQKGETDKIVTLDGRFSCTLDGLKAGPCSVLVTGYNEDENSPVMSGTSECSLKIGEKNSCRVTMEALSTRSGTVELRFDWTGLDKEPSTRLERLQQDGYDTFCFVLKIEENDSRYEFRAPVADKKTIAVFENIPASRSSVASIELFLEKGEESVLVNSCLSFFALQVYDDQVSGFNEDDAKVELVDGNYCYMLDSHSIPEVKGLSFSWKPSEVDNGLDICWNSSSSILEQASYFSILYRKTGEKNWDSVKIEPDRFGDGMKTICSLELGGRYDIGSQIVYESGYKSDIKLQLSDIEVVQRVKSIRLKGPDTSVIRGEGFSVLADVRPETATYKEVEWIYNSDEMFRKNGLFIPTKPGRCNITARSENYRSVEASVAVDVKCASVDTPQAFSDGESGEVKVSWHPENFATDYIVYRQVNGTGEFEKVGETREPLYIDTDLLSNFTYSYKVQATIADYQEFDVSSALSKASEPIKPIESDLVIDIPDRLDDLDMSFEAPKDLAITKAQPELKIALRREIDGVESYCWSLNGTEIASGSFNEAGSVTITKDTAGIAKETVCANNILTLFVTRDGCIYSASLSFVVADKVAVGVVASLEGLSVNAYSDDNGEHGNSEAIRVPAGATLQLYAQEKFDDFNTRAAKTGNKIEFSAVNAEVSETGKITIPAYSDSTKEASVTITPKFGASLTLNFDIYNPTVKSAQALVEAFNRALRPHFRTADKNFEGDWWSASSSEYHKDGVDILGCYGASEHAGSFNISNLAVEDSKCGKLVINSTSSAQIWAYNPGGFGETGHLGTDYFESIGYNNTGAVKIALEGNQGTATISFKSINVRNNSGYYVVEFDSLIGEDYHSYQDKSGNEVHYSNCGDKIF